MEDKFDLPFKVGEQVETKSFLSGFRGAWFRCQIEQIKRKGNELTYFLKYIDFPDEGIRTTRVFQKRNRAKEEKRELMVRPCFPPILSESEMPDVNHISELTVVVSGVWELGDLVDWWKDNCFWSGKITKLLEDKKAYVCLHPPPEGEGSTYQVHCKDLRPSLVWSTKDGWTFPIAKMSTNGHHSARLVKPLNGGGISKLTVMTLGDAKESPGSMEPKEQSSKRKGKRRTKSLTFDFAGPPVMKTSFSPGVPDAPQLRDVSTQVHKCGDTESSEKMKTRGSCTSVSDPFVMKTSFSPCVSDPSNLGDLSTQVQKCDGTESSKKLKTGESCTPISDPPAMKTSFSPVSDAQLRDVSTQVHKCGDTQSSEKMKTEGTCRPVSDPLVMKTSFSPGVSDPSHLGDVSTQVQKCDGTESSKKLKTGHSCTPISDSPVMETSLSPSVSDPSRLGDVSTQVPKCNDTESSNKMKTGVCPCLASSSTIESTLSDLEELLMKIKWMKGLLNFKTENTSWKFVERRA